MKKIYYILIVAMVASLLGGCSGKGSSASPPLEFTATAGDGRVKLTWTASPGVEYWLFTATDPSLTAFKIDLPNEHIYVSAASPFYMCGLYNSTPYYFATNGRTGGGPGGSSSQTISATPYNASTSWTANPMPLSKNLVFPNLNGVGYASLTSCSNNATSAAGSFVAVGAGGAIFTSNDGKNWNAPASLPPGFSSDLFAVAGYTANINNPVNPGLRWVAVGAGGTSVYSTDGISWSVGRGDFSNPTLRSLAQVSGTFFAVGDTGTILSSTDGITWTARTSGSTNNLHGVTHGAIYVAVGDGGTILTSTDGNTWINPAPVTPNILRQVVSSGNIIVAVGDSGTIVTSINGGATWTAQTLTGAPNLVGVAAESQLEIIAVADPLLGFIPNAQFVAVDSVGNAYTSANGITWSADAIRTGAASLNALASSGFGYVAAGNAGATAYAF